MEREPHGLTEGSLLLMKSWMREIFEITGVEGGRVSLRRRSTGCLMPPTSLRRMCRLKIKFSASRCPPHRAVPYCYLLLRTKSRLKTRASLIAPSVISDWMKWRQVPFHALSFCHHRLASSFAVRPITNQKFQ